MSDYEQAKQKLREKYEESLQTLEREYAVRLLLPADAEPRHIHAGSKLYGSVASVTYGDRYQSYSFRTEPSAQARTLAQALALVRSLGEVVPFFSVKDSSLALKPESAISESEREHAQIRGPYALRIRHQQGDPAELQAYVRLSNGEFISVDIVLTDAHKYGSWRRVAGNENYAESWRFDVVEAKLGHAQFVRYASGASTGPRSGSQHVYLFSSIEDVERLAKEVDDDRRKALQA